MARLARVVVSAVPHHITQRGNRREQTFFCDEDYAAYLALLAEWCPRRGVELWAYCLMPNHVHLIAVPESADGLRRAIGEVHRRYSRRVNFGEGWRGHLWQGRFGSFPMDDAHTLAAARYIELNPVRARLAASPQAWPWSSAAAHVAGRDDAVVRVAALLEFVEGLPWVDFLAQGVSEEQAALFRSHERTGRPLGGDGFVARIERLLGRVLRPRQRGPKGPWKHKGRGHN
jgi:putative transposase